MPSPVVPISLGLALVLGATLLNVYQRRQQDEELQTIRALRERLDSTKAALARATADTVATRLEDQLRIQTEGVQAREYHVPLRAAQLRGWWKPTGVGTLTAAMGLVLVLVGVRQARKHKPRAA